MKLFVLIALASSLTSSLAYGAKSRSHYFYSYAEGAETGWTYDLPECKTLANPEYKKLESSCGKAERGEQRCPTETTVNLKKMADTGQPVPVAKTDTDVQKVDETTKTLKLSYAVFTSMKACRESRDLVLKQRSEL